MSWIQENKFVAGLAGTTAVIGGAILFFGVSQGSAYNQKLEHYEELKAQYSELEKAKPYPSEQNLNDREDGIADYDETISEVRDLVTGYRPDNLQKMTPEQFKDIRVKMEADLKALFANKPETKLPEGCAFGFETYAEGSSVKAGATAKLNYELEAIQSLLTMLAEVKPESINNIRRVELPEERGEVAKPAPSSRSRGKARNVRGKGRPATVSGRAYELMPMELSFTASESAVGDFLMAMVNSERYYYSIRAVRIRNEKQIAPNEKDANFPVDVMPAADDGFGGLDGMLDDNEGDLGGGLSLEGEDEVAEVEAVPTVPAGELILKQVLGSEKLHIQICFDLVLVEKKDETDQSSATTEKR